jgi:hypothetical protein
MFVGTNTAVKRRYKLPLQVRRIIKNEVFTLADPSRVAMPLFPWTIGPSRHCPVGYGLPDRRGTTMHLTVVREESWRSVTKQSPPGQTPGRTRPSSGSLLRPLAPILERGLPELVNRLTTQLRREIPHYAAMAPYELHSQAETQVRYVLDELAGKPVPREEGPAAYGRMRADQQVPLDVVLHAYRVAWAELWSGLLAAVDEGGPSSEELLRASAEFFWMADDYAGRMHVAYRQRATELILRQESERAATLEGVFSGYLNGSEALWEAAAILDLPYEGLFVVVAAATPAAGREALPGVKNALLQAQMKSTWRLGPDVEAGIISLRDRPALERLLDELRLRPDVRAGLSAPYSLLADTPHALHLARLVLGTIPSGTGAIKQFAESPIGALLAASPSTADDLRRTVLGGLADMPEEDLVTLLHTLTTWFEAGGSIPDAAKRLYVHPNTVRYRLRRVQAQTQRSLDDPRDVADIRAALIAYDMIPAPFGQ